MLKNCKQVVGLLFPLFFLFILSGCASNKRTVDPYPDRSYTRSVAKTAPRQSDQANSDLKQRQLRTNEHRRSLSQQPSQPSISSQSLLPMLTLVNDRILAFEAKQDQWNSVVAETTAVPVEEEITDQMQSCQEQMNAILARYEELHQLLIQESNAETVESSVVDSYLSAQRLDIAFLEGNCQQIFAVDEQGRGWVTGTRDRLQEDLEREINEKMRSGEYLQVIDLYSKLPLNEGQYPSYETTYNYGQSLLRSGREKDAAEVFQELLLRLREQDQLEDEFKLMKLVADIEFSMENFDSAFERYIHIINRYAGLGENIDWARRQQTMISMQNSKGLEVRTYAELLRAWLTYNPERDAFKVYLLAKDFQESFPDSSVMPKVNQIMSESGDRAEAWFALVMQRFNSLKAEKKYQDAQKLLESLPMHQMTMDKREQLTKLNDELVSLIFEEQEAKRQAFEEEVLETWQEGLSLLRAKEYDQSITVFETLLNTTYAGPAKEKIVEASQLAAQEDRREAAELFVRAGNATDHDTQVTLLLQSRRLLQGILTKYPESGLVEKAKRNLETIEDQIRAIDPALLIEPEMPANDQEMFQHSEIKTIDGISAGEWKKQAEPDFSKE